MKGKLRVWPLVIDKGFLTPYDLLCRHCPGSHQDGDLLEIEQRTLKRVPLFENDNVPILRVPRVGTLSFVLNCSRFDNICTNDLSVISGMKILVSTVKGTINVLWVKYSLVFFCNFTFILFLLVYNPTLKR